MKTIYAGGTVAALLMLGTSSIALAQDTAAQASNDSFGDIIVTATRREERLQDVPVAVSAFTTEALAQQGVVKAEDLIRVTPGLQISRFVGDPASTNFGIRGQRTNDQRPQSEAAVVTYIAEVPQKMSFGIGISGFLDLKSIEVLRGPQGTLFGRNSTGGAVLLVPNTPTDEFEGSGKLTYGNYNRVDAEAMINVPIAEGVGIRLAGKVGHRDAWYDNRVVGFEDLASEDYHAVRGSFQYEADAFKTTFYGDYVQFSGSGMAAKPTAVDPTGGANAASGGELLAVLQRNQNANFWSTESSHNNSSYSKVWGVSNTTTYQLSDTLLLKNVIGYRHVFARQYNDSDGTVVDIIQSDIPDLDRQFSEEFQIQYDSDALKLIAGAFYFHDYGADGMRYRGIGSGVLVPGFAPVNLPDNRFRNTSISAFAEGTYSFTPELHLTLGARYTRDKRSVETRTQSDYTNVFNIDFDGPGPLENPTPRDSPNAIVCAIRDDTQAPVGGLYPRLPTNNCVATGKAKFGKVTWNATLQYEFSSRSQVYLSYRRGYRAGGFINDGATVEVIRSAYRPEVVDAFELGYKGDFDLGGRTALRLNLAAYYSKYDDIQKSSNRTIAGVLRTLTINVAKATIYGAETEAALNLGDYLRLSGSYTYTKAKYDSFAGVPNPPPFGYLPKHKLTGTARFELPVGNGTVAAQPSVTWQSGQYLDDLSDTGTFQKAYALVNARLEWSPSEQFTVGAWAQNLTKTKYYISGVGIYQSFGYSFLNPGEPRMYGLDFSAKF